MVVVVVTSMPVRVPPPVRPALGLERPLRRRHAQPKRPHHIVEHVVVLMIASAAVPMWYFGRRGWLR